MPAVTDSGRKLKLGKFALKFIQIMSFCQEDVMKSIPLIFMAVLLISVPAFAALYQWKDDNGVMNFTDNPASSPAKYLKRVKKRPSINAEAVETVSAPAPAPAEAGQGGTGALYGGHDEQWWRSAFGALRDELKNIEDALPAKRNDLEQARRTMTMYTYPANRQAYYDKLAEINRDEARIRELNDQLEKLDIEASKAGVPFDWRK